MLIQVAVSLVLCGVVISAHPEQASPTPASLSASPHQGTFMDSLQSIKDQAYQAFKNTAKAAEERIAQNKAEVQRLLSERHQEVKEAMARSQKITKEAQAKLADQLTKFIKENKKIAEDIAAADKKKAEDLAAESRKISNMMEWSNSDASKSLASEGRNTVKDAIALNKQQTLELLSKGIDRAQAFVETQREKFSRHTPTQPEGVVAG